MPHGQDLSELMAEVDGCRRLARGVVGDFHGGDDVAQEALLTGLRRAHTRQKEWRPWLAGIVRNKARESRRAARRRADHERAAMRQRSEPSVAESVVRVETQQKLLGAMLRLPEAQRSALVRRFFDNDPPRRIASDLGVPVETVRTRIKRGLERLRQDMTERHGGDERAWKLALVPALAQGGVMGSKLKWAAGAAVLILAGSALWWRAGTAPPVAPAPMDGKETALLTGERSEPGTAAAELTGRGRASTPPALETPQGDAWFGGRVVDVSGNPQARILVTLHHDETYAHRGDRRRALWSWRRPGAQAPLWSTHTSDDGRFRFDGLPPDTVLHVEAHPATPLLSTRRLVQVAALRGQEYVLVVGRGTPLAGQVVDGKGVGLVALLEVQMLTGPLQNDWRRGGVYLRGIRSDDAGQFHIPAVPEGICQVEVHVPGRMRRLFRVQVPGDPVRLQVFEAPGVTVKGRVLDEAGAPVQDVRITVPLSVPVHGAGTYGLATTDADGRFQVDGLPDGALGKLLFHAEGYELAVYGGGSRPLAAGDVQEVDVVLRRAVTLSGHVRNAEGKGLGGIALAVSGPIGDTQRPQTEADGAFEFQVQRGAHYQISGHGGEWYLPAQSSGVVEGAKPGHVRIVVPETTPPKPLSLVAVRGARLDVRVVDAKGRPVPGAVVTAHLDSQVQMVRSLFSDWRPTRVRTGEDGTCRISDLPPGHAWTIQARHGAARGKSEASVRVMLEAANETVQVVLRECARIAGRVVDTEGAGAVGVSVALRSAQAGGGRSVSVADGSFAFGGLEPGTYTLQYYRGGSHTTDVTVAWGEARADVILRVPAQRFLRGTLRGADGTPVALTRVRAHLASNTAMQAGATVTDAEGRFEIAVDKDTAYRLRIGRDWIDGEWTPNETVTAVLGSGSARALALRILGPAGQPVPQVTVESSRQMAGMTRRATHEIDGGVAAIRGLEDDEVLTLTIRNARDASGRLLGLLPKTVTVARNETRVAIQLAQGRIVRGVVEDEGGAPVQAASVRVIPFQPHASTTSDAAGRFRLPPLPQGEVQLRVGAPEEFLPTPVVRVPTDQEEIRVRVVRGKGHELRVLGAANEAVAHARVTASGKIDGLTWSRHGLTDADGHMVLKGLPARGRAKIHVKAAQATPAYPDVIRDVEFGPGPIVIQLGGGLWIEGTVFDEQGGTIAGVRVYVHGATKENRGVSARVTSDAEGNFRVGPVSAGRYSVSGSSREYAWGPPLEALAGARGVRLVLPRVATIEGRLHDERGMQGWSISFMVGGHTWQGHLQPKGDFAITGVAEARGTLFATRADGRYALLEDVRPSGGPFDLRPKQGATITGRIKGHARTAKGPFLSASRGGVLLGAAIEPDGTFTIRGVPPGDWTLTLRWAGEVVEEMSVAAGTSGVEFQMPTDDGK